MWRWYEVENCSEIHMKLVRKRNHRLLWLCCGLTGSYRRLTAALQQHCVQNVCLSIVCARWTSAASFCALGPVKSWDTIHNRKTNKLKRLQEDVSADDVISCRWMLVVFILYIRITTVGTLKLLRFVWLFNYSNMIFKLHTHWTWVCAQGRHHVETRNTSCCYLTRLSTV